MSSFFTHVSGVYCEQLIIKGSDAFCNKQLVFSIFIGKIVCADRTTGSQRVERPLAFLFFTAGISICPI